MASDDQKSTPDDLDDRDFDARLRAARTAHDARTGRSSAQDKASSSKMEGLGFAMRVGTELVAATALGVAVGYGLDQWLGSGPWLLIVFLFLGGAAGISNVYRLASGADNAVGWQRPGQDQGADSKSDPGDRGS